MSSVDERIVKMTFDNADFIKKVGPTIASITQLNKATDQVANNSGGGLSAMGKAFEQAEMMSTKAGFHIRDVWLKVASILEYQVAGKIVSISKNIANAMTFEGISDGFKEYELKMGSVQTILAGTGESLDTVNKYLEELNAYSDKTIYSFADMTNNIGKFTNAGVKLEDAVGAIKGIANEAARSGANANEASRAMYNFSQALSAGYVKLIDWKSIENANMATKEFKDTLLEVATAVGTVEKGEDGMYKVLSKNANGATMKETISATKNFNDSLAYQWMTTDVLTKTMKIYATDIRDMTDAEKAAYEEELRSMGMTDAQIKQFEELGSAATDAASEVKTFSMLIDTLKEAIGSGWAQTWEILIGDFEEAKELWTAVSNVLGGFIDDMSKSRNELLKGWDSLGGRRVIIDALKRSFDALVAVIKPIADGFRNIFPPVTATNLYNISKAIQRFASGLMITEETATKVRQAASGFFAIFDIGIKFVSGFVKALLPATKGISSLGGFLLDIAATIGTFLTKIDLVITKTNLFENAFRLVGQTIKPVIDVIKSGFSGAKELLDSFFDGFNEKAKATETSGGLLLTIFKSIANGFKTLGDRIKKLSPLFEGLVSIFKGLGKALGTLFKQIGDSISGLSFGGNGIGGLMNIFNAILSGGIMYRIFSGVKQFSKVGESFNGVLEGLGNALNSFGEKVGSETLLNTAKAVAILAGSLLLVAMIDSNKLTGATAAITAMIGGMAGAIALLMKAISSFEPNEVKKSFSIFGKELFSSTKVLEMAVTLGAVSKALMAMGAAVLMLSIGLKVVSSAAEGGHLWDSFAVISLMLAELTGVAIALGKWGGDTKNATKGLMTMTAALILMAQALKMVSKIVEGGNAWESLGIIGLMVAGLTGVMIAIDRLTKYKAMSMAPLISMAISINLLVIALKSVSDALGQEGQHIWQALGIIGIMVAGLAAVCVVLSKFAAFSALGGLGAIAAAAALLILVQSLKQISDALGKTDQHIWQALGVIAVSLLVLAVGLTAMAGSIPGAAALLIASAALIVLGGALKIIGSMSLEQVGKGLLVMSTSLLALALGLTAMIVALPGALALTVAAFGLTVLAGALKLFGSMSLGEIVKSLGMLFAALSGIAIISTVLSVASPFILVFSAALLVFSAALIGTGVGLTLFSAGLQALVAVMPMGIAALDAFAKALINLIPILAEKLMEALGQIATKIVEYGPAFTMAAVTIFESIITALVQMRIKFAEAVLSLILGMLQTLTENIPLIAQAGTDMMIAFMEAISTEIPRLVDAAYQCAIAFVEGLASAIENNNTQLIAAVDHLMSAVIQAIAQWLVEFTPLGFLIPENVKEGIMTGEHSVKDAIDDVIKKAVETIKGFFDSFKQAAEYVIGGLIEGLRGSAVGKVVSAAADLGNKIIGGLNSKRGLDENSPSKRAEQSGEYVAEGLVEGIENGTQEAVDASTELGDKTIGALSNIVDEGAIDIDSSTESISNSFKDMGTEVTGATDGLGDNISDLVNQTTQGADEVDLSLEGLIKSVTNASKEVNEYADVTDRARKTEERWGSTLKAQEAQVKKNQEQTDRWGESWKKAQEETKKATSATEKNTDATDANTKAQEKNTTATGKNGKAAKSSADVMEYASGVVEEFTKQYGHLYSELGEDAPLKAAQFAVRNLAEETYKASLKTKDATEETKKNKASIEDMVKAFTELKSKIYDSVKTMFEGDSFFQKFELKTDKSMKDMLEGMRSNVNAVASWTSKIKELGEKGLEQGLLRQLAELGPKGYEYVNAFSMATAEEIQEANALFAQAGTLPESASNSVVASYAKAGLNAVAGFNDALATGAVGSAEEATNWGLTTLSSLEAALEEESPSKRTYRDGMYLVQGLKNGINNYSFLAHNQAVTLALDIIKVFSENLSEEKFYGYGKNIAFGLANGMSSDEAVGRVQAAANKLSEIADKAITKYNEIKSPSKLYKRYGGYIAQGLALGMTGGTSYVEHGAYMLSEAIKNTMDVVESIAEDDMEIHPVISPVLDLTSLRNNAGLVNSLFPTQSIAMASSIGIGRAQNGGTSADQTQTPIAGNQINFTQNNYSPKALSRYEIYRDTKNQISMMKGVIANA